MAGPDRHVSAFNGSLICEPVSKLFQCTFAKEAAPAKIFQMNSLRLVVAGRLLQNFRGASRVLDRHLMGLGPLAL
jgi:hypothetical protein